MLFKKSTIEKKLEEHTSVETFNVMEIITNNAFEPNAFAEIIESSCSKFLAQSWDAKVMPKLGSLIQVKTNDTIIFGIITSIQTGSQDPMRYPFTYQKTEEELKREQPQIFEFLKTTFDIQIVGYQPVERTPACHASPSVEALREDRKLVSVSQFSSNKTINYSLPSTPPKIHSFVKNSNTNTIKNFFSKTEFLSLLFNAQISNLDEILLTILKNLNTTNQTRGFDKIFLNKFCSDFALLSGNDYKRLKLFLKRVQSLIRPA